VTAEDMMQGEYPDISKKILNSLLSLRAPSRLCASARTFSGVAIYRSGFELDRLPVGCIQVGLFPVRAHAIHGLSVYFTVAGNQAFERP